MNNSRGTTPLTKTLFAIVIVGFFIAGVYLILKDSSESQNTHSERFALNRKSKLEYLHYPDLKEVVIKFFDNYAISTNQYLDLHFEKRPMGWYVAVYGINSDKQKIGEQLFWSREEKAYKTFPFDEVFVEPEQSPQPDRFLTNYALMHYRVCPYYGYPGWDWDVIREYKEIENLPDSILYGLAYAYSSYASNLLNNNSGFAHRDHQFDLPEGSNALTNEQIKKYSHYANLAIDHFKKVAEINPSYQSYVGTIGIKASNEHLTSFLDMRIYQNEQEAQMFLVDGLYNDFYISAAKNYLTSCAPNAILFTGGDNDTYPLLYVQAHHGFRRDVLVVNLGLLGGYRYINSVREQILDAEGIPLSVDPSKYMEGVRNFAYVTDRVKRPLELSQMLGFLWSDDPKTRIKTKDGNMVDFLPSNQLMLSIDKNAVVENGVVNPEKRAKIVDTMEWAIEHNYLLKSHLVLLDILATNQWKRPVYFCKGIASKDFLGMEDYFQLEGMAYRLVPIKKVDETRFVGRIDTEILYHNLMSKFVWADMSDASYKNEYVTLGGMYRALFSELALTLVNENRKDRAVEVLDRGMEIFPEKVVPYNAHILNFIEGYFKAGVHEKAISLSERLIQLQEDNLNSISTNETISDINAKNEAKYSFVVLLEISEMAQRNNQTQILDKANEVLDAYSEMYQNI